MKGLSDCEELEGEVNHTTEYVTDLFCFDYDEWRIMWSNLIYLDDNGYSRKVIALKFIIALPDLPDSPEVILSQDAPLFVDLTMVPSTPVSTKVLFPNTTAPKEFPVGKVKLSQDEPLFVDLTI